MAIRLDVFLTENGYFDSREKAKREIMAGNVYIKGQKSDKPGLMIKGDEIDRLEIRGTSQKFVSRGGNKLDKAINEYGIDLEGKVCMDIGASTGGFTDCMLQNGAKLVYSVDVGYGQLDWKLRNDDRVVNMERTNIREVTDEVLKSAVKEGTPYEKLDFASIDVSFISLTKVIPVALNLLKDDGSLVYLIKPQFEAGREKVGKNGVVREKATHIEVLDRIVEFSIRNGLEIIAVTYSPIKGPKGNIEFLMYARKRDKAPAGSDFVRDEEITDLESFHFLVRKVVEEAHEKLKKAEE